MDFDTSENMAAITNLMKRQLKETVYPGLGGQTAACEDAEVCQQTLSDYANLSKPGVSIPLNKLIALLIKYRHLHPEASAASFPILTPLAQLLGFDLIQNPGAARPQDWRMMIASLSKEFADVVQVVTKALEDDGNIDAREVIGMDMIREVSELQSACARLLTMMLTLANAREASIAGN